MRLYYRQHKYAEGTGLYSNRIYAGGYYYDMSERNIMYFDPSVKPTYYELEVCII